MAKRLQVRRGKVVEVDAVTPANGEPAWVEDLEQFRIGNGVTPGGVLIGPSFAKVDPSTNFTGTYSDLQANTFKAGATRTIAGRVAEGDDGGGLFVATAGDFSAQVAREEITPGEGDGIIHVAPASDKTGASGAWVRILHGPVTERMAGMQPDDLSTDYSVNMQKLLDLVALDRFDQLSITPEVYIGPGDFLANNLVIENTTSTNLQVRGRRIIRGAGKENTRIISNCPLSDHLTIRASFIKIYDIQFGGDTTNRSRTTNTAPATTFTANASTDVVTLTADQKMRVGTPVTLTTTGTLPAPLATSTEYFWIPVTSTTGKLAASAKDAADDTAIDITDSGSGTHTLNREPGRGLVSFGYDLSKTWGPVILESVRLWYHPGHGYDLTNPELFLFTDVLVEQCGKGERINGRGDPSKSVGIACVFTGCRTWECDGRATHLGVSECEWRSCEWLKIEDSVALNVSTINCQYINIDVESLGASARSNGVTVTGRLNKFKGGLVSDFPNWGIQVGAQAFDTEIHGVRFNVDMVAAIRDQGTNTTIVMEDVATDFASATVDANTDPAVPPLGASYTINATRLAPNGGVVEASLAAGTHTLRDDVTSSTSTLSAGHLALTLTGNVTLNIETLSPVWRLVGRTLTLTLIQDATGGRTVAFQSVSGRQIVADFDDTGNNANCRSTITFAVREGESGAVVFEQLHQSPYIEVAPWPSAAPSNATLWIDAVNNVAAYRPFVGGDVTSGTIAAMVTAIGSGTIDLSAGALNFAADGNDVFAITDGSAIGLSDDAGTFVWRGEHSASAEAVHAAVSLNNSSSDNELRMNLDDVASRPAVHTGSGWVTSSSPSGFAVDTVGQVAWTFTRDSEVTNNVGISVDDHPGLHAASTVATGPFNRLTLGERSGGTAHFAGKVLKFAYIPEHTGLAALNTLADTAL